jgi:hypothetical protein
MERWQLHDVQRMECIVFEQNRAPPSYIDDRWKVFNNSVNSAGRVALRNFRVEGSFVSAKLFQDLDGDLRFFSLVRDLR